MTSSSVSQSHVLKSKASKSKRHRNNSSTPFSPAVSLCLCLSSFLSLSGDLMWSLTPAQNPDMAAFDSRFANMSKPLRQSCVLPCVFYIKSVWHFFFLHFSTFSSVLCCCFLFFMHAVFPNQGLSSHSFLEFNSIPFRFLLLFSDCFVFEKWLSHHFYCIFGVYDSQWSVMCVCVLGVCHKDLCVAIYTHAKTHTDKSKVKRLFDAYIEWNVASGMRQVASGKASNVNG